ncbi:hypothetical protein CYY_008326 [Polysphondylium violaceum]|uniref:Translation initiation factor eIF2B subunit delta n=1 Tax=Polysphondylium violaceum TaxID=133409 RepID=A0A8J4PNJ2_9MYCE|nr:hypothetical protein CYY_008326 [Polysphondylium violaceum]
MSSYNNQPYLPTQDVSEWLNNEEKNNKQQPSIRTVGFDTSKSAPLSIPSTSPSGNNMMSKSPAGGRSFEKAPLSSSQGKKSSTPPVNVNNNNNSNNSLNSSVELAKETTKTDSVQQVTNALDYATLDPISKKKLQQQAKKERYEQFQALQAAAAAAGLPTIQLLKREKNANNHRDKNKQQPAATTTTATTTTTSTSAPNKQQNTTKQSTPTTTTPSSTPNSQSQEIADEELKGSGATRAHTPKQFDDPKQKVKATKKKIVNFELQAHQVPLFDHLPQYDRRSISLGVGLENIHPDIINLGLKYADFSIAGSNARAIAMMTAFKKLIDDFESPPNKIFSRELDTCLKLNIQFLVDCRPISISMGNSINYLKQQMSLTNTLSQEEAKESLIEKIDSFIERIQLADKVITKYGVSKISDGDVILTYASSHVVEKIIEQAQAEGKNFRVIIVDSRPKHEGRELLHRLSLHGVKCTYIMLNAISYMMKEVSKVFVGAYSVLSNGNLISRSGTALVASMAKFYNVPFIVCCETYKFSERAQLDSICFNQIGNPHELVSTLVGGGEKESGQTKLSNWESIEPLKLLNLMYDLTPIEFIDMVISEYGMVPPTSIPVILREFRKEITL